MSSYNDFIINLETASFHAFDKIMDMDRSFVGTEHYLGVAYFWNYAYRHYLRDCTIAKRKRVHKLFLKLGLDVDGESQAHEDAITKVLSGVTLKNGVKVGA